MDASYAIALASTNDRNHEKAVILAKEIEERGRRRMMMQQGHGSLQLPIVKGFPSGVILIGGCRIQGIDYLGFFAGSGFAGILPSFSIFFQFKSIF